MGRHNDKMPSSKPAAGVVADRAEDVDREAAGEGGEHAERGEGHLG